MRNDTPDEKRLRPASFVVHVTRGVVRDQKARRRVMLVVLAAALLLLISGSTVLKGVLDPHERPGWFIGFWLVCAWLTITAILISVLDVLMVVSGGRRAKRELREKTETDSSQASANR